MDEFEKNKAVLEDFRLKRDQLEKDEGQSALSNLLKSKVKTTMIGSINSIEQHFGFLWNHGSTEELTESQKELYEIFQKLRTEILDKGNNQSRNIDSEISRFEVKVKKVNLVLPVRKKDKGNG
jgi:hypothetical protein